MHVGGAEVEVPWRRPLLFSGNRSLFHSERTGGGQSAEEGVGTGQRGTAQGSLHLL